MSKMIIENERFAHSVEEIAAKTSLSEPFLRNEIRAGNLKARKFGRRVLVLDEDLKIYLQREIIKNANV